MGVDDLPSGLVTFVVTDIEGSSFLLRQDREGYAVTLADYHAILTDTWCRHSGRVVDQIGDGSLAVFGSATDAVRASREAQLILTHHAWSGPTPRVRVGIHTGFTHLGATGYVSITLHQAHRIGQAANGGQTLITEATAAQADLEDLLMLGRYKVRDFDQPVLLFALPSESPQAAPRCAPAEHHNLRPSATALLGRSRELAQIDQLISEQSVLTLVGSAGVGKSHVAREWGLRNADDWVDGIWLMDCSRLGPWTPSGDAAHLAHERRLVDSSRLVAAISAALGLSVDPEPDGVRSLAESLRGRRCLVIFDNAERWRVPIAELIVELADLCPGLHVLTTSTEPLRIPTEYLIRIPPLPTQNTESPAVELFLERARRARPNVAITPGYRSEALKLCRRLDGLPLAVELAAARADILSPAEILTALNQGAGLPRWSDPTRPVHHHALSDLLAWHTAQLSQHELTVLRRLAFFPNSFDLTHAQLAAGIAPLTPATVTDQVWSLLDRSLLVSDPFHEGQRYRMLQTVRDVVLSWATDDDDLRVRAEQAVRLGEHLNREIGPQLPASRTWANAIDADLDILRAVLEVLPEDKTQLAQELASALAKRHVISGSFRSGLAEIRALAGRWSEPTPARVGLLTELGQLYARIGDHVSALRMADLADAIREQTGPPGWDDVGIEKLRGENALAHDRPVAAAILARATLRRPLTVRGQARMWNLLGVALITDGNAHAASEAFAEELLAARNSKDDTLVAIAYNNNAELCLRLNRIHEAAVHQRAALELAVALGQRALAAFSLLAVAQIVETAAESTCLTSELQTTLCLGSDDAIGREAVRLAAYAEMILGEIGMPLFGSDAWNAEEFAIKARRRLGSDEYHQLVSHGKSMDDNAAVLAAMRVLDAVVRQPVMSKET